MTYKCEGWGPNLSPLEIFKLPYGYFNYLYGYHAHVVEERMKQAEQMERKTKKAD